MNWECTSLQICYCHHLPPIMIDFLPPKSKEKVHHLPPDFAPYIVSSNMEVQELLLDRHKGTAQMKHLLHSSGPFTFNMEVLYLNSWRTHVNGGCYSLWKGGIGEYPELCHRWDQGILYCNFFFFFISISNSWDKVRKKNQKLLKKGNVLAKHSECSFRGYKDMFS